MWCAAASGQSADEAVHALAGKVLSHLAVNEVARVSVRNVSSLGAADAVKIQPVLERELRRRVRNASPVEVALTISENARGFLLVAQVKDFVEMAPFRRETARAQVTVAIAKTMVWQQDAPILDVATVGDETIVLDTQGVARYQNRARVESVGIAPMPRDPRGRLEISGDALIVHVAGATCHGTWKPVAIECAAGGEITANRNTMSDPDWPPYYSRVHTGEGDFVAETDGRVHVFDASRKETTAFAGWGSDLVPICGGARILASGPGDRESPDFVAAYEPGGGSPARVSDPSEFPGPVTALTGSIALAHNLSTGRYEAYSLTIDCGH